MTLNLKPLNSVQRFAIIGIVATVTHLIVGNVLIFVEYEPLKANLIAFSVAFFVSFFGHYYYSFSGHDQSLNTSLMRFLITALIGFGVNQVILWCLLSAEFLSSNISLIVSTVFSAASTYLLSKFWAFRFKK